MARVEVHEVRRQWGLPGGDGKVFGEAGTKNRGHCRKRYRTRPQRASCAPLRSSGPCISGVWNRPHRLVRARSLLGAASSALFHVICTWPAACRHSSPGCRGALPAHGDR